MGVGEKDNKSTIPFVLAAVSELYKIKAIRMSTFRQFSALAW
jgi:hypothetical protein